LNLRRLRRGGRFGLRRYEDRLGRRRLGAAHFIGVSLRGIIGIVVVRRAHFERDHIQQGLVVSLSSVRVFVGRFTHHIKRFGRHLSGLIGGVSGRGRHLI